MLVRCAFRSAQYSAEALLGALRISSPLLIVIYVADRPARYANSRHCAGLDDGSLEALGPGLGSSNRVVGVHALSGR